MSEVFLSYAREDADQVLALWLSLTKANISVWFDKYNLAPGQDWKLEIDKAIRDSKVFMACLSRRSVVKRGFVQSELRRALDVLDQVPEGQVFLMPVRLDECEIPQRLQHLHCIDAFEEGALARLVSTISQQLRGPVEEADFTSVEVLGFAQIKIDAADPSWAELPAEKGSQLFGRTYRQSFELVEFVHDADLVLDVTLLNRIQEPTVLTHVGIEILRVAHQVMIYGIPTAAKIAMIDSYEIELPDIYTELSRGRLGIKSTSLKKQVVVSLPDPVYFEGDAPYRFSLRLKRYSECIPNRALIRLLARSTRGDAKSHAIATFSW